jgi:hypothetical protein
MARDRIYEDALNRQGVKWCYEPMVEFDLIDDRAGLRNQARLENALDPELVEAYRRVWEDGGEFPAMVLWRPSARGKYRPLDGNHKLAAAKADTKHKHVQIDAYVIETDDEMVANRVAWTFNNMVNGRRLSKAECLEHAKTFVLKYGMSQEAACKEWDVSKWELTKEVRAAEVKEVLDKGNVKGADRLTRERLNELAPLRAQGEDVLVEAAKVVVETGAGADLTSQLVSDIKKAKTTAAKFEAVKTFRESEGVQRRRAETKGGTVLPRSPRPSEKLSKLIHEITLLQGNFPDKAVLRPPGKKEFERVREEVMDIIDKWVEVFGVGSKPERRATHG